MGFLTNIINAKKIFDQLRKPREQTVVKSTPANDILKKYNIPVQKGMGFGVGEGFTPEEMKYYSQKGKGKQAAEAVVRRPDITPVGIPMKIPFIQRETLLPSDFFSGLTKGLVETPGRVFLSGKQAISGLVTAPTVLRTGKIPNIKTRNKIFNYILGTEEKPYEIETYQERAQKVRDEIIEGRLPLAYAVLPFIEVPLDFLFLKSVLNSGAKALSNKIKVPAPAHQTAWEFLGRPKDITEAASKTRKLQKVFHPDVPSTGNKEVSMAINNAYTILKNEGIPKQPLFPLRDFKTTVETLNRPISQLGRVGARPTATPFLQLESRARQGAVVKPIDFESTFTFGKMYSGMPKNKIYQPNGNLQPSIVIGRVNDAAQKLERNFPGRGLGTAFKKTIDINKVSDLTWLRNKTLPFWKMGEQGKSVIPQTKFFKGEEAAPAFKGFKDLTTQFLDYAKGKTTLSRQEILDFARRPELKKGEADMLLRKLEEFASKTDPLAQEVTKLRPQDFATEEEFVSSIKMREYLSNAQLYSDEAKKSEYRGYDYDKKEEYISYAVDKAQEAGIPVILGQDNTFVDIVPVIYFELPEGQVSFHLGSESIKTFDEIIKKYDLPKNIKIVPNYKWSGIKNSAKILENSAKKYNIEKLIETDIPNFKEYGIRQTKSQLTDIWNKVNKGSKLPAQEFADSIRRDLLELKPVKVKEPQHKGITIEGRETGLRSNLAKGKYANETNYEEVVFESPITTNGSSHYPNSKKYFAHARGDEVVESGKKIWREQEIQSDALQKDNMERLVKQGQDFSDSKRNEIVKKNIDQLQPFTNDRFGERIMRERIKEKAQKGYEKYRLPTGETIGKIEGFEAGGWTTELGEAATPLNIAIGDRIMLGGHDPYIVTKKLDNGQIKAINETSFPSTRNLYDGTEFVGDDKGMDKIIKNDIENYSETFDLTGKSNPQYRRYENWGKFLKNKYQGKEVTDPQGNKWVEIDLKPEYAKEPVVAFKKGGQEPKYLASEKSGEKLLRKMLSPDEAKFLVWDTLPKQFGDAYGATEFLWNSIKKKYDVIINVLKKDGKVSQDVIVHEIMHPYVELFLNAKEKVRVFNEVLRHHGKDKVAKVMKIYGDDKGLVAEELLANDWQEFLRTGKTYSSVIKGFFNRLWDFLQRLIGRRGNVEKLFNDILARKRPSRVISTEGRLEKTRFKLGEKRGLPEIKQELAVLNDVIKNHPAFPLTKFANKSGELPEVIGRGGKFGKEGDTLVTELGFSDSEAARQAYEDLQQLRNRRKELRQSIISSADEIKATPPVEKPLTEAVSVEKQAKQALRRVAEPMRDKVYSLPEIIKQTSTDVKQKVNIFDYIRTPEKVLQKIGFEEEAKLIRQGYEAYLKELPVNLDKITQWFKGVPKESNERIFRYLDGKDVDLTAIEKRVAGEISDWLAEWADRLKLPADKRISHYVTHIFDEQLIAKEFDEDLAKIITDKIPGEIYDPFLLRRLGAKGYKQDTWAALDAYAKRATRKANMDNTLENLKFKTGGSLESSKLEISQFKYIQRYISHINLRPTELDNLIDNAIKNVFGYRLGQRPVARITKLLRQMTYRGMLGLNISSSLRNISQGINTYAVLGEKYTAIGYANLLKRGAYKELEEQGVLHSGFIQDRQLHAVKKALEKTDKVLFAFFDTAEKINRGSAYFGAKAKAIKEGKNIDEAIQYAKKIVRQTQFAFGSIDTPVAMQSDIAKTLVQFQTYTVKQIEFLTEMAKDKNFVGLLRYALAGTLFIFTIGRAFGMKPEELIPDFRFGIPPSLKFPIETTKAVLDVPDKYGRKRDIKRKVSDVGKSLVGLIPGGTQARKTLEGLRAIKERGVYNRAGKLQYEQGQSTLKKIQALLFGKYASKEAQEYFEKKETGKSKNAGSDILEKYNIPTTNQSGADDILKKYNIPIK